MNVAANKSKGEAVDSFLAGKHSQVDVRKIESELSKLWNQASVSSDDDYPQVIRACSCNLILYTDKDDAETNDANLLDDVLVAHPARALLTICRESEQKKLEAWVTARCHLSGGKKQVCSELITILAEGHMEQEMVSVIESLLLGDLPTYLWWTVGDLSGEKLGPFLGSVRRLVVDSAAAPYSFSYLRDLRQIVDSTDGAILVSDLNWRRLFGIRAAIAEELERKPFGIDNLAEISKVRVSSCGQEFQDDDCSIQAMLLVGWLASRLGWDPVSFEKEKSADSKGSLAKFDAKGKTVEVEFKSIVMSHVAPGAIFEIEIELNGARCLRVCRDPSGETGSLVVMVKENGQRTRELFAEDNDKDRVHLMGYELEEMGCDKVFAPSLESAYELLHLLEE